jgi:hypothetical protein
VDTANQNDEPSAIDGLEAQREIIRQSLTEIAGELDTALYDVGLRHPVYLAVPYSGNSVVTIATPVEPPDADWSHISATICQIIGERLGGIRLRSRDLQCVMVGATMSAADVTAG